ncbi:MAG: hypothetical protein ACR2JD_01335 [Nocardioides sp.]
MARTVFFHIGLPKTGTTYLQTILWNNREELRRQGVLLPGFGSRQHLWASAVVRGERRLRRRRRDAPAAWDELVREVNDWRGSALITHEFFAGATQEQAARAIAALGGAQVHVVVTARDTVSLVTARWQEFVKNGATIPIDDYLTSAVTNPRNAWDWGTMDVADVLRRWGAGLPSERVHVLTLPKPAEPRETLWLRFAELVGIDPATCDAESSEPNESLGVVEVELLRRVNGDLKGFRSALHRGVWIRGYLAQGKLVPRKGEKFWPSPDRVQQLRERGDHAVAFLEEQGYDVVGDLADLRTPAELPERRHPDSVTDTELLDAASATTATMLADVRRLTNQKRRADARAGRPTRGEDRDERGSAAAGVPGERPLRTAARRARALWRRSQRR